MLIKLTEPVTLLMYLNDKYKFRKQNYKIKEFKILHHIEVRI
jgi:uncharacterized membrane protein YsdA (DUF1294 family)